MHTHGLGARAIAVLGMLALNLHCGKPCDPAPPCMALNGTTTAKNQPWPKVCGAQATIIDGTPCYWNLRWSTPEGSCSCNADGVGQACSTGASSASPLAYQFAGCVFVP